MTRNLNRIRLSGGIFQSCSLTATPVPDLSKGQTNERPSPRKRIQIVSALVDGCSIRSIERMYDVHRDTITRLMVHSGQHCMSIMDGVIRYVPAGTIQVDELWTYVRKKDKHLTDQERHNPVIGSQYIFVAMDAGLFLATRLASASP